MSSEGPPPVYDGEDFPYWKIRMETYLEAVDENRRMALINLLIKERAKDRLAAALADDLAAAKTERTARVIGES